MTTPDPITTAREALTLRQVHERHQWAQPGDEPDRVFILKFSDPDCRDHLFTGKGAEERAIEAWNLYSPNWNVYLFATMPTLSPTAPFGRVIAEADKIVEGQAARIAELEADIEKLTAERDEEKLAKLISWDRADGLQEQLIELTSQLEQAERVIKPFAEFVDCLDEELPDDEEYNTELGLEGYHSLTCGNFRDASQWYKDRQAKGEAS